MLATHCTREQLESAAAAIGIGLQAVQRQNQAGTRWHFRLAPIHDRTPAGRVRRNGRNRYTAYRTASYAGAGERAINSVCWHGHREFFRALFRVAPEARIQTTLLVRKNRFNVTETPNPVPIRWYTAENFDRVYRATGSINIGSQVAPQLIKHACHCPRVGASLRDL